MLLDILFDNWVYSMVPGVYYMCPQMPGWFSLSGMTSKGPINADEP